MTDIIDINKLKENLAEFAQQRDWGKFHSPKNLSMAIANEAGELLELFQWLTEKESADSKNSTSIKEQVSHELADIVMNVIRLADILEINMSSAIESKFIINNEKYPADKVKGSAKKYTQYSD